MQKEAELKLRLETLLSKRMAAALRTLPSANDSTPKDHVEWKAVEEGFRLLERDLAKLQVGDSSPYDMSELSDKQACRGSLRSMQQAFGRY